MMREPFPQARGVTLHLTRHTRGARLPDADARTACRALLCKAAAHSECAVHAYVLMGNHLHLLLTPARANGATQFMALVHGNEAVQWEPGFHAAPVYFARYLLACMRYIERNPVRAGIVSKAADYRWSSHRANAYGDADALVSPHPFYCALGRGAAERQAAYRELFRVSARSAWRYEGRRDRRFENLPQ